MAHPICAPTPRPTHTHTHYIQTSYAATQQLGVFTASNICKSRWTAILLPLLLLLLPSLCFNCTTTRLEWTIGLFMCILFCHTKDSYVHRSRRGWINRPVSHGRPPPDRLLTGARETRGSQKRPCGDGGALQHSLKVALRCRLEDELSYWMRFGS